MSENITNVESTNTTMEATAAQPAETPSTAVNVDINAIISQAESKAAEAAEKKMEAVFKSMLQQQGLDADAINTMTAEWKSKQVTPEQTIQKLSGDLSAKDVEIAALKQEKVLRAHGLTDDEDIEIYSIRINKLVTDDKTFEQAAKEYFEAHPRPAKIPASATYGGAGKTPMTPPDAEEQRILNAAKAAMRIK